MHGVHNYMCNQCPKAFSREDELKRHVEEVHKLIKHPCDLCDYKATQVGNLKRHMDKVHQR